MKYNLENTLKAKQYLIDKGFSESDFYEAESIDVEVGYLLNEPLIKTHDDTIKSAFELYKEGEPTNKEVDNYLNFLFPNGL